MACGTQSLRVGEGEYSQGEVESALSGDNEAGQNLAGVNLAAANLAANNLAGNNLAAANLGGTNLAANNLAANNLAANNLAGTNLAGNNLAANNLAATNLAATNLAGNSLAGVSLAGTTLGQSTLNGSTDGGTATLHGGLRSNTVNLPISAVTFGPDAGTALNIHRMASVGGLLSSGEDVYGQRGKACVVLGVGSVAFSRLVADNGSGPMFGALKKQPWGFTDSTGKVTIDAWELVVWGPSRYCVFVIAVPPAASFDGVRGFVKAIFRWNAPPSMSMTIGDMDGVVAPAVYTGMMGTAALYASGADAGIIDAQALVGGELAFASATTNNIAVKVDFSSWIRTKAGQQLILANVGKGPDGGYPSAIDGVFSVSIRGDGTASLVVDDIRSGTSGLDDYKGGLVPAYVSWWAHVTRERPVAKRCLGDKVLTKLPFASGFREARGKCDAYSAYISSGFPESSIDPQTQTRTDVQIARIESQSWSSWLGAASVRPFNDVMIFSDSLFRSVVEFNVTTGVTRPISSSLEPTVSETYVFLNEPPFNLCVPETDDRYCTRHNQAAGPACAPFTAFDNCQGSRTVRCNCTINPPSGSVEAEPNDWPGVATPITLGIPVWSRSLSTGEAGNVDWFSVVVPPGKTVALFTTPAPGSQPCIAEARQAPETVGTPVGNQTNPLIYTNKTGAPVIYYLVSQCADWTSMNAQLQ